MKHTNTCWHDSNGLVQKYIGTAYDKIKLVADNLDMLQELVDSTEGIQLIFLLTNKSQLDELNTDYFRVARMYDTDNFEYYNDYMFDLEFDEHGEPKRDEEGKLLGTWNMLGSVFKDTYENVTNEAIAFHKDKVVDVNVLKAVKIIGAEATSEEFGTVKLFATLGDSKEGTITQKALTDIITIIQKDTKNAVDTAEDALHKAESALDSTVRGIVSDEEGNDVYKANSQRLTNELLSKLEHMNILGREETGAHPATAIQTSGGASVEDALNELEDRTVGQGVKIYHGTDSTNGIKHVQNGDAVPAGTTHLAVVINGKVEDVAMSPVVSGVVANLTEVGATIGGAFVDFVNTNDHNSLTNRDDADTHPASAISMDNGGSLQDFLDKNKLDMIKQRERGQERLSKAIGGIVSVQYDGGYVNALNTAWDLHKARGIPADFAIDGDTINDSAVVRANISTMLRVQKEGGRFSSHGLNVQALGVGTSEDTIRYELEESRRVLSALGLDIDGFVAPQGQFDQTYVDIAKRNYTWLAGQANVYDGNQANSVYKDSDGLFNIHRVSMASNSVSVIKSIIDYCILNDEWVVLYDHDPSSTGPVPPASVSIADLTEILDYIQSSGIRALSTSDAISAQFQDAAFGYEISRIADKVALLNARQPDSTNYLKDTQFASRLNANGPWLITNTVDGTVTYSNTSSTIEDRLAVNFAGNGVGTGQLLITQDVAEWRTFGFGSGLTFAIEMLGNNLTSGAIISLGLRVIDTSDNSALDTIEKTFDYKNNRSRVMSVSLKNHSELNNATITVRAYIRISVSDASKQFTATIINPRLTTTSSCVPYRKNIESGLNDRSGTLESYSLISGSWVNLDFTANNIGELYKVSAGRYASLVAGTYLVAVTAATSAADPFGVRIVRSSGAIVNEGRGANGASSTAVVKLNAGDYFDVQARQLTGADINLSFAYLNAERIK